MIVERVIVVNLLNLLSLMCCEETVSIWYRNERLYFGKIGLIVDNQIFRSFATYKVIGITSYPNGKDSFIEITVF